MSGGTDTALIAGTGRLPAILAAAQPDMLICEMDGFACEIAGAEPLRFRVERLVPFFDALAERGITRVIFAGAMHRPRLDPELFDPRTAALVPRLLGALQGGDDATLRAVIDLFEEFDFSVVGADAVAPGLVPEAGVLCGTPSDQDRADIARAAQIVTALGAADVGQGAVVAQGLCLATEALPGTDAMLQFVAQAKAARADMAALGGVFYKAPKPAQDRRIDLPALGVATVQMAARAGLSGIAFEAGGVLLIDRDAMIAAATEAGLFLWARQP